MFHLQTKFELGSKSSWLICSKVPRTKEWVECVGGVGGWSEWVEGESEWRDWVEE